MRGIVTWFVNNSVPSNLFMFFLIVGGFFISYPSIKAEFFPTPDPKAVTIVVPYPGASASEVEASISSKIEDRLEGVAGIKKINSRSLEGYGYVGIRVFPSADFDNTVEEIKTIIDGITSEDISKAGDSNVADAAKRKAVQKYFIFNPKGK